MQQPKRAGRGLYDKLVRNRVSAVYQADILQADMFADEALDLLENEEPSLVKWLDSDSDLDRLARTNSTAIYWMLADDIHNGRGLEDSVVKVDKLMRRLVYVMGLRATLRQRAVSLKGNDYDPFFAIRDEHE